MKYDFFLHFFFSFHPISVDESDRIPIGITRNFIPKKCESDPSLNNYIRKPKFSRDLYDYDTSRAGYKPRKLVCEEKLTYRWKLIYFILILTVSRIFLKIKNDNFRNVFAKIQMITVFVKMIFFMIKLIVIWRVTLIEDNRRFRQKF